MTDDEYYLKLSARLIGHKSRPGSGNERISDRELMSRKSKPASVSDARWRIELRRRRQAEYFRLCPHPDGGLG